MLFGLKAKLRRCHHINTNSPYEYVRKDATFHLMLAENDYQRRLDRRDELTGIHICLDCGATQRFLVGEPWVITEPWVLPHIWGGQGTA